ncbi:hypothetical protein C8F04DRAFT_1176808 [Mycena alexandri]|uniref:Uncharacterized protein n=1 Tax=Mycena alexandri TaxID=1745969 RepID=A0AAD6T9Q2_9AGAR|nr:hypothetical protein C8F04DRAFT_1176808 [Mycena alexandri]
MAKLLAGLEFNVDFKLGRQRPVGNGNTVHHYVLSNNEEPAEFLIIGTLSSVIDRPGEPKVLILNVSEGHFPILQSVFRKQISENLSLRVIRNPTIPTQDMFDLSNKPDHPLKIIAPEVTVDPFSIAPVPKGSLLMSSVIPFRVDMPAQGAPTVHSRVRNSRKVDDILAYGHNTRHMVYTPRTRSIYTAVNKIPREDEEASWKTKSLDSIE